MAQNPGAWESPEAPVVFVELPASPVRHDAGLGPSSSKNPCFGEAHLHVIARMRQALASGKSVVVYPYSTSPSDAFDAAGVRKVCGSLAQTVQWQGVSTMMPMT